MRFFEIFKNRLFLEANNFFSIRFLRVANSSVRSEKVSRTILDIVGGRRGNFKIGMNC